MSAASGAAADAAPAAASAAGAANRRGDASFSALPDELVVAILRQLPRYKSSFSSTVLVSKRFRRLRLSPPMLSTLSFDLPGDSGHLQRSAGRVAAWLKRHAAGIVTRLSLKVGFPVMTADWLQEDIGPVSGALAGLLLDLPALNTNSQLRDLRIDCSAAVSCAVPPSGAWALAMRSLQVLEYKLMDYSGCILVQPHLALLSGLHTLKLHGCLLDFPAGLMPCFPPAATRLELRGSAGLAGRLPQQVAALPRLSSLHLESMSVGSQSFEPLRSLPALDRLELFSMAVPACLSALTGLRTLRLDACTGRDTVAAATEAGLSTLTGLTQLVLGRAPAVPQALARLTNLARFGWLSSSSSGSFPTPDSLRLPGGAWLAGVQEMSAPAAMVDASLAELAPSATPSLRQLSIPGFFEELLPVQARILAWVSTHPALRRLTVDHLRSEGSLRALVAAMDRNPALAVGFSSGSAVFPKGLWPEPEPF